MEFWNMLTDGFMPHGYCLHWYPPLLLVFIAGNVGIALAYFLIPCALQYFVGRRKDLPYVYMWRLFAVFIISCGITHLLKVFTLYQPIYWVEAAVDFWTAVISLITAVLLIPLIPQALKLRGPKELEEEVSRRTEQLRHSEARFKHLADAVPAMVWTCDNELNVKYLNQRWYEYTGARDSTEQAWRECLHADDLRSVIERWEVAKEEQTAFEIEERIKARDGTARWFLVRAVPVFGTDSKNTEWFGTCTDINDRKEQEQLLEHAVAERTAELKAALDAKSRFLSTISHEVRTPMAGVIGLVELIAGASSNGDGIHDLAVTAMDSCNRLLQILNDLLDASRLQAGAVNLELRYFSVRPVIGDLVQLVSPEISKKHLEISSCVAENVPELVCGDELRVRQILQNLVFNAVKFTERGKISITVELASRDGKQSTLKFSVADTGIGITVEQQKKIFEPFVQAEDSTTRIYGGTGLGLSICRTLTQLMGGEIGVTSSAGGGSTFWFVIPFRDDLCKAV